MNIHIARATTVYGVALAAACCMRVWAQSSEPQRPEPGRIDISESSDRYVQWLAQIEWPTEDVLLSSLPTLSEVPLELESFGKSLATLLRPEYRPTTDTLKANVRAIERLGGREDCLLLRYETQDRSAEVQIREGRGFVISLFPLGDDASERSVDPASADDLGEYVLGRYTQMFRTEKEGEAPRRIEFFTSNLESGRSKLGSIYNYAEGDTPGELKDWRSSIQWWSDGHNVSFLVGRYLVMHPEADPST